MPQFPYTSIHIPPSIWSRIPRTLHTYYIPFLSQSGGMLCELLERCDRSEYDISQFVVGDDNPDLMRWYHTVKYYPQHAGAKEGDLQCKLMRMHTLLNRYNVLLYTGKYTLCAPLTYHLPTLCYLHPPLHQPAFDITTFIQHVQCMTPFLLYTQDNSRIRAAFKQHDIVVEGKTGCIIIDGTR